MYLTLTWNIAECMDCHFFKVEYNADAEYENPLKNSEKIAGVGQRLL